MLLMFPGDPRCLMIPFEMYVMRESLLLHAEVDRWDFDVAMIMAGEILMIPFGLNIPLVKVNVPSLWYR